MAFNIALDAMEIEVVMVLVVMIDEEIALVRFDEELLD